jgi:hypothetical protein
MNDSHLLNALAAELSVEVHEVLIHHELGVNCPELDLDMLKAVMDTDQGEPGSGGTTDQGTEVTP